MKKLLCLAAISAFSLLPGGIASAFSPVMGARPVSLGGSYRGLADDNSAIFYNPAGLTQAKRYSIGAGYSHYRPEGINYLYASVVDTKTSPLGAGVAYVYQQKDDPAAEAPDTGETQELAVAVAQEYLKAFHLGFTVHYLWREAKENGWRLDASTLIIPTHYFILGVVGKNLVPADGDQREVHFAAASRIGDYVNLDFDLIWLPAAKNHELGYNLGGEIMVKKIVGLRGGYSFDREKQEWYGLGLGWKFPRGTVDYAFRREVGNSERSGHWLELSISI